MVTAAELPTIDLDGERFMRPDFAGRGLANLAAVSHTSIGQSVPNASIPRTFADGKTAMINFKVK